MTNIESKPYCRPTRKTFQKAGTLSLKYKTDSMKIEKLIKKMKSKEEKSEEKKQISRNKRQRKDIQCRIKDRQFWLAREKRRINDNFLMVIINEYFV